MVIRFLVFVLLLEEQRCEKCPHLLSIENVQDKLIPVVMAITQSSNWTNTMATAQYLYSVAPKGILSPTKGVNGATFVTRCIYSGAFGKKFIIIIIFI